MVLIEKLVLLRRMETAAPSAAELSILHNGLRAGSDELEDLVSTFGALGCFRMTNEPLKYTVAWTRKLGPPLRDFQPFLNISLQPI